MRQCNQYIKKYKLLQKNAYNIRNTCENLAKFDKTSANIWRTLSIVAKFDPKFAKHFAGRLPIFAEILNVERCKSAQSCRSKKFCKMNIDLKNRLR